MKKLSKILAILLVLLMVVGCSAKKDDPKKLYEGVYEKMKDVKSMDFSIDMGYTMKLDENVLNMGVALKGETDGENVHTLTTASVFGTSSEVEQWVVDGVGYQLADGDYSKFDGGSSDMDLTGFEFDPATVKSYELSEVDGKKVVTLTLSEDQIGSILDNDMLNQVGELGLEGLELSPIEVVISNDFYFEQVSFTMKCTIESIDAEIALVMKMSNFNNAKVNLPDLSLWDNNGFNEEDGTYTPTYAMDIDITNADEAALAALGFEKVDENVYLNSDGTIAIDTEWKYFTLIDGDIYAEYDWEYQIANDYTYEDQYCSIDYEYNEVDDSCSQEQIDRLDALHNAFITLWNNLH